MKKLTVWSLLIALVLVGSLVGCTGNTGVTVVPELRDWFSFACDVYKDTRPVIVALLDAAEANPEIVPEKYRDDVKKFREETGPKLDRSLNLLCAQAEGQQVAQVITAEKSGVDWNAIALNTVKVATVALQLYGQSRLKTDLTPEQTESLAMRLTNVSHAGF